MAKNIVIEIEDGIIHSVYCPDGKYNVHILDWNLRSEDDSQSVVEYFEDVEKEKKNLKDCY
jgi:hypothetical protein